MTITLTIKESYNNSRCDCWVSLITTFLGGQKKAMSGGQSSRLSLLLRQICPDALMQCKTNTAVSINVVNFYNVWNDQ